MGNCLPAVFIAIDYQAIAACQPQLLRKFSRYQLEMAEDHLIFNRGIVDGANHLLGDDQDVYGSLSTNIVEGQAEIVFISDLCGDGFIDNLEEDVIREHVYLHERVSATIANRYRDRNGVMRCPG